MSKTSNFFWSAILAVFLFLPSSVMGQVWFGVGTMNLTNRGSSYTNRNEDENNHARVENGGELTNRGEIGTATINGGGVNNTYGVIGTATINGGGVNNTYGEIGTATVNDGTIDNRGGIGNVEINDGSLYNYNGYGEYADGWVGTATINGGTINNQSTINYATVNGGTFNNNGGGLVGTLTVNGGTFNHSATARWVGNATLSGGTINNGTQIIEMTYISGTYNAHFINYGLVDSLTLAGNSALNTGNWGNIENLVFDKDGNGIATLTAFDNGNGFGFNGIKADYVDFFCGNISLDLTGFGGISELYGGFYLSTLFGATGFSGVENLSSLGVTWGDDSFWILNGGVPGAGWSIDSVTGFVSHEVPEPATLLMLGLAAAGIPVVRRVRKRVEILLNHRGLSV